MGFVSFQVQVQESTSNSCQTLDLSTRLPTLLPTPSSRPNLPSHGLHPRILGPPSLLLPVLNSYSRIYLHPSPSRPFPPFVRRALVDLVVDPRPPPRIQPLHQSSVYELVDLDGMDGGVFGLAGVRDSRCRDVRTPLEERFIEGALEVRSTRRRSYAFSLSSVLTSLLTLDHLSFLLFQLPMAQAVSLADAALVVHPWIVPLRTVWWRYRDLVSSSCCFYNIRLSSRQRVSSLSLLRSTQTDRRSPSFVSTLHSVLSGAFHAVGYYDPFSSSPEITILHAKRFV